MARVSRGLLLLHRLAQAAQRTSFHHSRIDNSTRRLTQSARLSFAQDDALSRLSTQSAEGDVAGTPEAATDDQDELLNDEETFDFDFTDFDDDDNDDTSPRRPRIVWAVDDDIDRYTVDFDDIRTVTNHASLTVLTKPGDTDELDPDMQLGEIDQELAYLAEAEAGVTVESAVKALLDAKGGKCAQSAVPCGLNEVLCNSCVLAAVPCHVRHCRFPVLCYTPVAKLILRPLCQMIFTLLRQSEADVRRRTGCWWPRAGQSGT